MTGAARAGQGGPKPATALDILPMRRALLAATVTASLLTSGAGPGLLDQLWHLLSSAWGATETPDEGCGWDPYGRCLPAPAPQPDEGCGADAYGCPQGS